MTTGYCWRWEMSRKPSQETGRIIYYSCLRCESISNTESTHITKQAEAKIHMAVKKKRKGYHTCGTCPTGHLSTPLFPSCHFSVLATLIDSKSSIPVQDHVTALLSMTTVSKIHVTRALPMPNAVARISHIQHIASMHTARYST